MVYIVRRLQLLGAKLYEPLPLRTSLIPCHMKIDTQALLDMLVYDDRFDSHEQTTSHRLHSFTHIRPRPEQHTSLI